MASYTVDEDNKEENQENRRVVYFPSLYEGRNGSIPEILEQKKAYASNKS
jgi:hypothetical protein